LATSDVHPPLYFTFLWGSIRLFGHGEMAVRAPSILFGVLLIPLVYLLGTEAYDRRTGALASIIVAVAPFTVWYSQEARMYSQLMVFSVLALWSQLRVLRRGGWFPWAVYALSSVAMIATQYFGLWQLLAQQFIFVVVIASRWRREGRPPRLLGGWLCAAIPMAVSLAPLALLMKQQFSIDQATGQAFGAAANAGVGTTSIYSIIANISDAIIGFHSSAAVADISSFWPLAMLSGLALLGRRAGSVSYLLLVVVVVPFVGMFVLAEFKESLGDVRYLSTTVPVLLLLLARGLTALVTGRRLLAVVVGALIGVLVVGLADQQFSAANPRRFDFRQALLRVDAVARPGDQILFDPVNVELNTVTAYYSPRIKASALTPIPNASTGHTIFVVVSKVLMGPSDRATLYSALGSLAYHRHRVRHWVFPNVDVWVYR
jgi:uncharacterized membrane protein